MAEKINIKLPFFRKSLQQTPVLLRKTTDRTLYEKHSRSLLQPLWRH